MTLDPRLLSPDLVDPETAAYNDLLEAESAGRVPLSTLDAAGLEARRRESEDLGLFVSALAADRSIPGPAGPLSLRVFTPPVVRGVYLHLHGGGFCLGSARYVDDRLERLAVGCDLAVASVEYRLAPEHPHPAAADDAEAAALWLAARSEAELGSSRLLIGGESAGANLAVVTLLRMRDRHGFSGFRGANLSCGWFDLGLSPSARGLNRDFGLNRADLEWFTDQYAPGGRHADPDVSPVHADLHGLPPALFTVGSLDLLLDDSVVLASRWLAAGSQAELAVYPGGDHSFHSAPTALAEQARLRIERFLRESA